MCVDHSMDNGLTPLGSWGRLLVMGVLFYNVLTPLVADAPGEGSLWLAEELAAIPYWGA